MIDWFSALTVLAQDDPPKQQVGFIESLLPLMIPFVIIFFIYQMLIGRPQRREKQERENMLKALKKNDRVVTIGGILGTVANISAEGEEVTLRVDDNIRIHFRRSSIQTVLTDDSAEGSSKKS